jgi:hypothetical protein
VTRAIVYTVRIVAGVLVEALWITILAVLVLLCVACALLDGVGDRDGDALRGGPRWGG